MIKIQDNLKPQTLKYGNGNEVTRLEETNTFLVHSSELEWGDLFVPTIFVEGIIKEEEKIKFDFHKAYKNKEDVILHCEYRSTSSDHKLIVHTQ